MTNTLGRFGLCSTSCCDPYSLSDCRYCGESGDPAPNCFRVVISGSAGVTAQGNSYDGTYYIPFSHVVEYPPSPIYCVYGGVVSCLNPEMGGGVNDCFIIWLGITVDDDGDYKYSLSTHTIGASDTYAQIFNFSFGDDLESSDPGFCVDSIILYPLPGSNETGTVTITPTVCSHEYDPDGYVANVSRIGQQYGYMCPTYSWPISETYGTCWGCEPNSVWVSLYGINDTVGSLDGQYELRKLCCSSSGMYDAKLGVWYDAEDMGIWGGCVYLYIKNDLMLLLRLPSNATGIPEGNTGGPGAASGVYFIVRRWRMGWGRETAEEGWWTVLYTEDGDRIWINADDEIVFPAYPEHNCQGVVAEFTDPGLSDAVWSLTTAGASGYGVTGPTTIKGWDLNNDVYGGNTELTYSEYSYIQFNFSEICGCDDWEDPPDIESVSDVSDVSSASSISEISSLSSPSSQSASSASSQSASSASSQSASSISSISTSLSSSMQCTGNCCYEWVVFPGPAAWELSASNCAGEEVYEDDCMCAPVEYLGAIHPGEVSGLGGTWLLLRCVPCGVCTYTWSDSGSVWNLNTDACILDCECAYPYRDGDVDGEQADTMCGTEGKPIQDEGQTAYNDPCIPLS